MVESSLDQVVCVFRRRQPDEVSGIHQTLQVLPWKLPSPFIFAFVWGCPDGLLTYRQINLQKEGEAAHAVSPRAVLNAAGGPTFAPLADNCNYGGHDNKTVTSTSLQLKAKLILA